MDRELIKQTKQLFFTYRNGILADYLRKSGDKHKMIFGLNLSQIISIAQTIGKNKDLSEELWADTNSREARIIAPMLMPIEEFSAKTALNWCNSVESIEVADVLCHRLLKNMEEAESLAESLLQSSTPMNHYIAFRLYLNLISCCKINDVSKIKNLASNYRSSNSIAIKELLNAILEYKAPFGI